MAVCACKSLIREGRELVMNSMTIIVTCDPPCTHDTHDELFPDAQ